MNANQNTWIKAVFFDMGGTLEDVYYDSGIRLNASQIILQILRQNNLDPGLTINDFHELLTSSLKDYNAKKIKNNKEIRGADFWNKYVFKDFNISETKVNHIAELLTFFLETMYFQRTMREEVPYVLERIKHKGLKVGCISNIMGTIQVPYCLQSYGILEYFDTIILSCLYGLRKPDPGIFHYAARMVKVKPAQCVYVGDTISRDIIGSKNAGFGLSILIPSFLTKKNDSLVKSEKINPDIVIQNLKELLEVI